MWKPGPLPPGTYNWGGVVPTDDSSGSGFFFADFCGDHVEIEGGRVLKAHEVLWYNNSIELPPGKTRRTPVV